MVVYLFWRKCACLEHYVLHQLRNEPAFVPELDFVMLLKENDEEGKLIGQNMFMRKSIKSDEVLESEKYILVIDMYV